MLAVHAGPPQLQQLSALPKAIENTAYFNVIRQARDAAEFDQLLKSGTVLFGIEVPAEFERSLRRGDRPALLFAAPRYAPMARRTWRSSLWRLPRPGCRA